MNVNDAVARVGELLEVDDTQYAPASRVIHLNEAMTLLSRQYETRLNEAIVDITWGAGVGSWTLSSIGDTERTAEAVDGVLWLEPANENKVITGEDISQTLTSFGDTEGEPHGSNPSCYSLHGGKLYIRPIPSTQITVRVPFHGTPRYISVGTNAWLTQVPWAVIYRTCEIGALWTGQDERVGFFKALRTEHMEMFNIADASKYDTPTVSEEPG